MKIDKDTDITQLPRPFHGYYDFDNGETLVLFTHKDKWYVVTCGWGGECRNASKHEDRDDAWRMFFDCLDLEEQADGK